MKAILVEDMPQAIQMLQSDLEMYCPEVEVIGTAPSIVAAAKLLRQCTPDVIFLDILLSDGTGFDLLEIFPHLNAQVIFVTASDEYAIRAFRYAAIDYLLKPVDPAQLKEAVQRAATRLPGNRESLHLLKETINKPDVLPSRISLHSQDRILVVDIDQIIRCEADGNNTRFVLANGERVFVTRTLKQFDQILERHQFIRVHQSHLVQFRYIQEFQKKDGGYLKMKNGDLIPVSVRKKAELLQNII
jgi:two-component system, LytTR family, response regulator